MTEDEEDVDAVLGGHLDRFERIVKRYEGPLLHLALRMVADRSMAEDMAQAAFVSCFRSLESWRREAAFSTWLFSIALNVYRSALRRAVPASIEVDDVLSLAASPEQELSQREEALLVRRAVSFLPARYRDPLVVFYFRECDLAETADVLGIPETTLKTRLRRGRQLLAHHLETMMRRRAR